MRDVPRHPALSDAVARRRAATQFDRNLVVVAGAGTGKTALLVERVLNLVVGASIPMRKIAAITFTKKAAADLRRRLAGSLDELRVLARSRVRVNDLPCDTEAERAYAWLVGEAGVDASLVEGRALSALTDLDFASVATLDAFCADILRRYPREAGVDPGFVVDEGPTFESLFEVEWESFLAEELGPRAPRAEIWRRVLQRAGALEDVHSLGAALASFRLPSEATVLGAYRKAPSRALFGKEVASLLSSIADIRRRATGLNPNMETFLDLSSRYLEAFLDRGPEGLASVADDWTLADYLKMKPVSGRNLTGCAPEDVQRVAMRTKELLSAVVEVDEETIAAVVEAAAPLAQRARERLLAAGFVSFDGLLRLTRDLLAHYPTVRHDMGAHHSAILVDEFQDTNPLQYEIVFFLAEESGGQARDAYMTRLVPGRLFLVGDPQQSIYRFRSADIEAYQRASNHVKASGGEVLTLDNSFRSPDEIIGPINTLFGSWIGLKASNEQPAYEPLVSAREPSVDVGALVEIWSVVGTGNVEDRREAEGDAVAAWIVANRGRPMTTGKPLQYKHVALLFRAFTNVDIYAQALRRADLPFVVEGGKNFYERPEVGDLIAFLRSAVNPNDGAALLAVLRGPLGGVPDAQLAAFAATGGRLGLVSARDVDANRLPELHRALGLVESFRATIPGRPPDDIIRAALLGTPLLVLHAAQFEGAQRVANLRMLVSRAEELARHGLSLEESLRALETEFKGQRDEGESPLADETVDAVRILTVHKAKGLEFDVVFVPDVGRENNRRSPSSTAVAWVTADSGFLAARLADGVTNLAWVRQARTTQLHEEAEEKRVFYVACTRARERLILVNSNVRHTAPWRDALSALDYSVAGGLPPDATLQRGAVAHRLVPPPTVAAAPPRAALDDRWRQAALRFEEAAAAAAATTPPLRSPARAAPEGTAADDSPGTEDDPALRRPSPTAGSARDVARLAGSAVHSALQRWDFRDARQLRDLGRQAARLLEAEPGERAGGDLPSGIQKETGEIIDEFLASPLPKHLASASVLGREVPILFRDEAGVTWSGACDLVYRDGRDQLVVADYKTERLEEDPVAASRRHRRQLEIYLEALRRALPNETVRGEIIFVRAGISVSI